MKKVVLLISSILVVLNIIAGNNIEAKKLFENSKQKLSLKNVHLVFDLETFDGKGNSKTKALSVSFGEFEQLKKVMVEFIAPENIKGTKILTTDYPDKQGIIEIYMPSTGKIQKIRANQHNLKIMGSEIPINQFSTTIDPDCNFTLLGKESIDGLNCHKIKMQKINEKGYEIAFVSVEKEYLLRIEKYDEQNKLVNQIKLSDYIEEPNVNNKVYPKIINVKNYKTGKSSNMKVRNVDYLKKVDIKDFTIETTAS